MYDPYLPPGCISLPGDPDKLTNLKRQFENDFEDDPIEMALMLYGYSKVYQIISENVINRYYDRIISFP